MTVEEYDRRLKMGLEGMDVYTLRAYASLCREARRVGWPDHFADDLFRHDRMILARYNPRRFAWALYPCGTQLFLPQEAYQAAGDTEEAGRKSTASSFLLVYGCCFADPNIPQEKRITLPRWYWYTACQGGGELFPVAGEEALHLLTHHGAGQPGDSNGGCTSPGTCPFEGPEYRPVFTAYARRTGNWQEWLPPCPNPYQADRERLGTDGYARPPYCPVDTGAKYGCPSLYPER